MEGSEIMTLYNNRASIVHTEEDEIYIFRNIGNKIIMNYYTNTETKEDIIVRDVLGEFDILVNKKGQILLIYQNREQYLKELIIDVEVLDNIDLTSNSIPKVFELNIKQNSDSISIIYAVLNSSVDRIFEIHHYLLKDGEWTNFIVEEIKVSKVLNPIKILKDGDDMLLFYYQENEISMKRFDFNNNKWEQSIKLTDNNDKLYIDIIKEEDYFHLVYSKYQNENLIIKYVKCLHSKEDMIVEKEVDISNQGNPSNPTLIIEGERLWIVWNESNKLLSRYSDDKGLNWSSIYLWKESKFIDMIRYKYISNVEDGDIDLDYGFGTMYPDIKFLGFGPLVNVEEISIKKDMD